MVKQAVDSWADEIDDISIKYTPKGSYTNNTNVRQDSDVDIAVVRTDFHYFDAASLRPADQHSGSSATYPSEGSISATALLCQSNSALAQPAT